MKNLILTLSLGLTPMVSFANSIIAEETGFNDAVNLVDSTKGKVFPSEEANLTHRGIAFSVNYHSVYGNNYLGRESNFVSGTTGLGDMYCRDGSTERFVDHEVKMDPMDVLDGFRIWGTDSDAGQDMRLIAYRQCTPAFGSGPLTTEILFNELLEFSLGEFSVFNRVNLTFEGLENECKIMTRIAFGSVGTCNGIQDVAVYKVRTQLLSGDLIFRDNFDQF